MNSFLRPVLRFLLPWALVAPAFAQVTDPRITSWVTASSAKYARVYETASDKSSGNAVSTWPRSGLTNGGGGQATSAYSEIQRVAYSTNYVYVQTTGYPSYTMGNWLTPNGTTYTSWPANRAAIHRIPRNPSIPTTKQKNNGSGGVLVNGVYVWQNGDAQSYSNANSTASSATISMSGDGIWNRLAGIAETFNFDPANGHQPSNGAYHNHINPKALRYQLGDNVTYDSSAKSYSESGTPTRHSPILGWANDGLPIYGPYGYSSALDAASGIRRMTSGFVKRDATNAALYGVDDLAVTGRHTLPVWSASVQGRSQTLTAGQYGPTTTATYALGPTTKTCSVGTFAEDYEYLGDFGKTQGVDFDLNRQNVRYCVTPEFPGGTYAYYVCIDASGNSVFPDVINQEYFGSAAGGQGTVTSITESVTEYADAGPAAAITVSATASGSNVALSWNSAEGATYQVESSPDNATWTTLSSAVTSGGLTTNYTATTSTNYYRVTLTAMASYDTGGTYGTPVGKTATAVYGTPATAPSITTQPASQTVTAGTSVTFTVVASGTATLSYQWSKGGAALPGATSASYTIASPTTADTGSYTVTVTNSAGSTTSNAAALTVNAAATAPAITTAPANLGVTVGSSATFTVVASGTAPLSYQWSKDGSAISGATSSSYTVASAQTSDAGSYTVAVTNSAGSTSSPAATLTVTSAATMPTISTQPASATVTAGSAATFTVGASGTAPLSYQWYKGSAAISGATSSTYSIASTQSIDAGSYVCVVTNNAGSVSSSTVTLTVSTAAVAPSVATQPASATVAVGGSVLFSVTANGTAPLSYQWYKGTSAVTGATTSNYALTGVQTADAGSYTCVVANSVGSVTTDAATLTVGSAATAPMITAQPANATVTTGGSATFSVTASGTAPLSYQWQKAGVAVSGATSATYTIAGAQPADADSYACVVTNSAGTVTSSAATLTVTSAAVAPGIATQPTSSSVAAGASATFAVVANGTAPLTYQWQKDGVALAGATGASYAIASAQTADAGSYACVVTNSVGSATSSSAVLTVTGASGAPAITAPPSSVTVVAGAGATFTVTATGSATLSYQWYQNSVAVAGATAAVYAITSAQSADAGSYTCTVTNHLGSVTSSAATLTVTASTTPSATLAAGIVNLAVRTRMGGGAGTPIVGFVLGGAGAGKRLVVRAVGPTLLASFGLTGALADPQLQLWSGATLVASNDDWLEADAGAMAAAGAFPLNAGSGDAAIVRTLTPGAYTTPVAAPGDMSGVVLVEAYDSATADTSARLINASARAFVGTGDDVLIPGFVIAGEGTVRMIVRAVGPGLTAFGVPGVLDDPQITLYSGSTAVATNDDWGNAASATEVASVSAQTGAFALQAGSKDAVLLVSLSAGAYTAVVRGAGLTTGTVLMEVYVAK
jgi:hypothetical protein